MPIVKLNFARAERDLGVVASLEREPSGELWVVLRSRKDNRVIAQARVPAKQNDDRAAPTAQTGT